MFRIKFAIQAICLAALLVFATRVLGVSDKDRAIIEKMHINQLILNTLSLSYDLRDYGKYHCYYDPEQGPKACPHMTTVSGQYEDFYQSTMSNCQDSKLCEGQTTSISTWTYMTGNKRICEELVTKSCDKPALTEEMVRQELYDLIDFKASLEDQL